MKGLPKVTVARAPTHRQIQVLRFLHAHRHEHGYPPTIREACDKLGLRSTNAFSDHLAALERKALITRQPSASRSVTLTALGLRYACAGEYRPVPGHPSFSADVRAGKKGELTVAKCLEVPLRASGRDASEALLALSSSITHWIAGASA